MSNGYGKVDLAGWEREHYAGRWSSETPAPEPWAAIDVAWMLSRDHVDSVRDLAARWGWGRSVVHRFLRAQLAWQVAQEPDQGLRDRWAAIGRRHEAGSPIEEHEDGQLFELPTSPHTHADLVSFAVRWLRGTRQCVAAFGEITTACRVSPDAIGFTSVPRSLPGWSILVECKVSRGDFRADRAKPIHLAPDSCPGQERWYLTPPGLVRVDELPEGWGLAEAGKNRVRIVHEAHRGPFSEGRARQDMIILLSVIRRHEAGAVWFSDLGRFEAYDVAKARKRGGST